MADVLTIRDTAARAKAEGLPISENAIRVWIKQGKIPVVRAGTKQLVYFPNLVRFITCADGDQAAATDQVAGQAEWRKQHG